MATRRQRPGYSVGRAWRSAAETCKQIFQGNRRPSNPHSGDIPLQPVPPRPGTRPTPPTDPPPRSPSNGRRRSASDDSQKTLDVDTTEVDNPQDDDLYSPDLPAKSSKRKVVIPKHPIKKTDDDSATRLLQSGSRPRSLTGKFEGLDATLQDSLRNNPPTDGSDGDKKDQESQKKKPPRDRTPAPPRRHPDDGGPSDGSGGAGEGGTSGGGGSSGGNSGRGDSNGGNSDGGNPDRGNSNGGRPPDDSQSSRDRSSSGGGESPDRNGPSRHAMPMNNRGEFYRALTERYLSRELLYPEIICSQSHALAGEPIGHYCTGHIARVWIDKKGVPVVFHDTNLQSKPIERLALAKVSERKRKAFDSREPDLLRLSDYIDKFKREDEDQNQEARIYLDIKSARKPKIVVSMLNRSMNRAPEQQHRLKELLVMFLPSLESYTTFSGPFEGYRIAVHCKDLDSANAFLERYPDLHFRFEPETLISPLGEKFVQQAKQQNRDVFVGLINLPDQMKWCIKAGVTGVITERADLLANIYWDEAQEAPWKEESMQTLRTNAIPLRESTVPRGSSTADKIRRTIHQACLRSHRLKADKSLLSQKPKKEES
ncbi:hypothetical protein BJY04DRAFT_183244 [Aspergillus karnatakaensis]|uniref:uncharacterized protein n=1 Tax=Aspergillus karnatakaensis TaxID=1810916 RepID=UPI003CCE448E